MTRRICGCLLGLVVLLAACGACAGEAVPAADASLRQVPWTADPAETLKLEKEAREEDGAVVVEEGVTLYALPARRLTYRYEEDKMSARIFVMEKNTKAVFSSLFYSLCGRYGVPLSASTVKTIWHSGAITVTLTRGQEMTVSYEYLWE